MVIHGALLIAHQLQPVGEVTPTVPVLDPALKETLMEERAYVHGAAVWLTVKVWPAIVKVPVRAVTLLLAATA